MRSARLTLAQVRRACAQLGSMRVLPAYWALVCPISGCLGQDRDAATAEPRTIDSAQMLQDLETLSADSLGGRLVGSVGNRIAREYIVQAFRSAGLRAFGDSFTREFAVVRDSASLVGVNVIGFVEGTVEPGSFIVITAHYDHLGTRNGAIYNGADDNASGTAALIALAAFFVEHRPRHSIMLVAMDAEEGGLTGSRAFVAEPPVPLERMAANVNLDMVSHSERELHVAGTYHYPFLRPYVERAADEASIAVVFGHDSPELGSDDWTNSSDHAPFHEAGIPFLYFGVEDHPDYHRPTDVYESINPEFYVGAMQLVLNTVSELDGDLSAVAAHRQ